MRRVAELRRVPLILWVAYLLAGAFVVLQPEPEVAVRAVVKVQGVLQDVGLSDRWTTFRRVEVLLNVALFAPITFLGRLALPRSTWSQWVAWSFIGSFAVEAAQELFLVSRTAEYSDVVANTLGALVGVVAASLVLRLGERVRR